LVGDGQEQGDRDQRPEPRQHTHQAAEKEADKAMYKRRNEVERLFRRLKGLRRIFSRFEKLDAMFLGFLSFVLVADGLRGLC